MMKSTMMVCRFRFKKNLFVCFVLFLLAVSNYVFGYQVCGGVDINDQFDSEVKEKLYNIHNKIKKNNIKIDMCRELPEQFMNTSFVKNNDRVLELGANIGTNTLVLGSLVGDSGFVISSEVNKDLRNQLNGILKASNLDKRVSVIPAIGKSPLIYRAWVSKPWKESKGKKIPKGWSLAENTALPTSFDTLVADCEGCVLPLLDQYPGMLANVKKIIIENDVNTEDYAKLKKVLTSKGFSSKKCVGLKNHKSWPVEKFPHAESCFYEYLEKDSNPVVKLANSKKYSRFNFMSIKKELNSIKRFGIKSRNLGRYKLLR